MPEKRIAIVDELDRAIGRTQGLEELACALELERRESCWQVFIEALRMTQDELCAAKRLITEG